MAAGVAPTATQPAASAAPKLPACAVCWDDPTDPVFLDDEDFCSDLYCYDCVTHLLQSSSNNFTAAPRIMGTPLPGTSCRLRRAQGNWIHNASYRDGYTQRVKSYIADWSPERQVAAQAAATVASTAAPAAPEHPEALFTSPLDGAVSSVKPGQEAQFFGSGGASRGRGRGQRPHDAAASRSGVTAAASGSAAARHPGIASRMWAHIGRGKREVSPPQPQQQPAQPPLPRRSPQELATELTALGDDLMHRGCPLDAIDLYQQACYALAGQPAEQQAAAKTALELCKAECKLRLKRYSASVQHSDAALALAPDNVRALHLRGKALLAKVSPGEAGEQEVSEAVLCLQRAAELAAAGGTPESAAQVSAIVATLREARGRLADSESPDGSP